jgi:NDP-hexose-3-ketoreductase
MKIRIGVVGCANIASRSVMPALLASKEFELVAVASRSGAKAAATAATFACEAIEGYQALLDREDIDAVYVPLPTGLHEEWILRAIRSGKHVLTEKALAVDLASADRLLTASRECERVLMEDFMYRYHSQHRFVREHLDRGTIGSLRLLRAAFGFPPLASGNFRYKKALGGGVILDAAAYTVNVALWLLGHDLEVSSADIFVDRAEEVSLYGAASLRSAGGLTAQLGFGFCNFYQCTYELWGSKGSLLCDRAFTAPPTFSPKVRIATQGETTEYTLAPDNHFVNIVLEFARCIRNRDFTAHHETMYHQSRLLTALEQTAQVTYA